MAQEFPKILAKDAVFAEPSGGQPSVGERTLLLLGKTGNGKSTLGNVILGTHITKPLPHADTFKECELGVSETLDSQEETVYIHGLTYRIIDTIGVGDTGLSEKEILQKLADTCANLRNGISQILFVSSGRFTKEEKETYRLIQQVLFTPDVCQFVTIVRTHAPYFQQLDKCAEDIRRLKNMGDEVRSIFSGCAAVIHVNNPPATVTRHWPEVREKSRRKLLERLSECKNSYNPQSLQEIQARVAKHLEESKSLEEKKRELEAMQARQQQELAATASELTRQQQNLQVAKAESSHDLERAHARQSARVFQVQQESSSTDLEDENGPLLPNSGNKSHGVRSTLEYDTSMGAAGFPDARSHHVHESLFSPDGEDENGKRFLTTQYGMMDDLEFVRRQQGELNRAIRARKLSDEGKKSVISMSLSLLLKPIYFILIALRYVYEFIRGFF